MNLETQSHQNRNGRISSTTIVDSFNILMIKLLVYTNRHECGYLDRALHA